MICNNFYLFINIYIWDINPYYDIVTFVGTFHILSDTYITYLLKKRVMYKDFLSGMNTHPHTEDQTTCTYFFPKHLLVTCKGTLYS